MQASKCKARISCETTVQKIVSFEASNNHLKLTCRTRSEVIVSGNDEENTQGN